MFGWFKKKAPVFGCPQPVPEPPCEYPDDWIKRVGDWTQVERCHCGQPRGAFPEMKAAFRSSIYWRPHGPGVSHAPFFLVCPRCGHSDKWSKRVERLETEYSPSRPSEISFRNIKTVVWTPECCEVVDE